MRLNECKSEADGNAKWYAVAGLSSRPYIIPLASHEGNVSFYFDSEKRLIFWKQQRWMTGP